MRKRAKRDLAIGLAVVTLLAALIVTNYMFGLSGDVAYYTNMRVRIERERAAQGVKLMSWDLITNTRGNRFTGPSHAGELLAHEGEHVNILGFMTPINRYRNMTEFMLLPLPIECYFCNVPPMSHVVWVRLKEGETTHLFKEPVLINGIFRAEGVWDEARYFYAIHDAELGAGQVGGALTPTAPGAEHMAPQHGQEEQLLEGREPPRPSDFD